MKKKWGKKNHHKSLKKKVEVKIKSGLRVKIKSRLKKNGVKIIWEKVWVWGYKKMLSKSLKSRGKIKNK